MRMYESMNKGAREGVEYKGRVLLSLQHRFCKRFPHCIFVTLQNASHRLSEDIQRQSNGRGVPKHTLSTKGLYVPRPSPHRAFV